MEQRSLKRSREDSESRESSSSGQSESQERLQRMRRENRLPMQDTESSQKINDKREKTALEFLTSEEHKNLNSGLQKDASQRDMKESLAIKIFRISINSKNNNDSDLFIESLLKEIRENNPYKQAYGSEGSSPHQQVKREELNTREAHAKADQYGHLPLLEQVKQGLVTLTRQSEITSQTGPSDHLKLQDQVEQPQATLGEQLYTLEQQSYEMQKQIQAIRKQHQAGSSNFVTRDFLTPLDQEQAIQTQQQEAGSSRQGDPSSLSGHLKSIDDDFAIWWSLKSRELHDQTQATSSQNTPEIRQPFAAYHPAEVQHESISQRANVRQQDQIGQRQDAMVQQHEVQDKVDLSKKTSKKILRDFFDELQNNRLKITDTRVSTMLNKNNVYTKKDLRLYSESALELYKEALDKKSRNIYDSIARLINRKSSY